MPTPIDRRPWRKRWAGKPCMKIQIRDECGGEIGIETHLSEAQFADVMRICMSIVADEAKSLPNQEPPHA